MSCDTEFKIKRNDTKPKIKATMQSSTGTPLDLTGASVQFIMRDPASGTLKVDAAATITDAAMGKVEYTWIAADTDTSGQYDAEFEIEFADLSKLTLPTDNILKIIIIDDLNET